LLRAAQQIARKINRPRDFLITYPQGIAARRVSMMKPVLAGTILAASFFAWRSMAADAARPRIVGMAYAGVRVHDLNASRHFYTDLLGLEEAFSQGDHHYFKVNDRQFIVLTPESKPEEQRFVGQAWETDDAEGLRLYLKAQGIKVPEQRAGKAPNYDLMFQATDPDDNVFFVMQYTPESLAIQGLGKHMSDARVSHRMLHVGVPVSKPETVRFYVDILGFREFWRANAPSGDTSLATLANLKAPAGDDYLEWHLSRKPLAPWGERKGPYHIALEVPDMARAIAMIKSKPAFKDYTRTVESHVGQNHKVQGNFYDPDGTRVELMEDHTADGFPSPMSTAPLFVVK
jgi:lactoylglutathione lyase